jgi:hypothetical protein
MLRKVSITWFLNLFHSVPNKAGYYYYYLLCFALDMLNGGGSIHGGCSALLVDM